MPRGCDEQGCARRHAGHGFCGVHLNRRRRAGLIESPGRTPLRMTDAERLSRYSQLNPDTGCVEWTAARNRAGYGVAQSAGGGTMLAHRLAMKVAGFDIDGLVVRHLVCDNPPCINTDHLAVGTVADNSADMVRKGRQGERSRKLTFAQGHAAYVEYHLRRGHGARAVDRLAEKYGVSEMTVRRAIKAHARAWAEREEKDV